MKRWGRGREWSCGAHLLGEGGGQLTDDPFGIAAVAAQGALAGEQAVLGPAGDGLGGDLQDGRDFGRPQEACGARRRPRRLVVHRDLTRCLGCRGRVTAPGPDLFRTWIWPSARASTGHCSLSLSLSPVGW